MMVQIHEVLVPVRVWEGEARRRPSYRRPLMATVVRPPPQLRQWVRLSRGRSNASRRFPLATRRSNAPQLSWLPNGGNFYNFLLPFSFVRTKKNAHSLVKKSRNELSKTEKKLLNVLFVLVGFWLRPAREDNAKFDRHGRTLFLFRFFFRINVERLRFFEKIGIREKKWTGTSSTPSSTTTPFPAFLTTRRLVFWKL